VSKFPLVKPRSCWVFFFVTIRLLNMDVLRPLEPSEADYPATHRCVREERNPQLYCCENQNPLANVNFGWIPDGI